MYSCGPAAYLVECLPPTLCPLATSPPHGLLCRGRLGNHARDVFRIFKQILIVSASGPKQVAYVGYFASLSIPWMFLNLFSFPWKISWFGKRYLLTFYLQNWRDQDGFFVRQDTPLSSEGCLNPPSVAPSVSKLMACGSRSPPHPHQNQPSKW